MEQALPSKSRSQQNLMRAAEHGASFPMAKKVAASMSMKQLHEFAAGSSKGKPTHVSKASGHPHANLGKYLHSKKG